MRLVPRRHACEPPLPVASPRRAVWHQPWRVGHRRRSGGSRVGTDAMHAVTAQRAAHRAGAGVGGAEQAEQHVHARHLLGRQRLCLRRGVPRPRGRGLLASGGIPQRGATELVADAAADGCGGAVAASRGRGREGQR